MYLLIPFSCFIPSSFHVVHFLPALLYYFKLSLCCLLWSKGFPLAASNKISKFHYLHILVLSLLFECFIPSSFHVVYFLMGSLFCTSQAFIVFFYGTISMYMHVLSVLLLVCYEVASLSVKWKTLICSIHCPFLQLAVISYLRSFYPVLVRDETMFSIFDLSWYCILN